MTVHASEQVGGNKNSRVTKLMQPFCKAVSKILEKLNVHSVTWCLNSKFTHSSARMFMMVLQVGEGS